MRSFLAAQYSRRAHLLGGASLHRFIETFVARDANGSVRRDIVYPRLIADFGGDATSAPLFVADYVDGFGAYCRPPADLFPTLATLRAAGFRLGVITNGEVRIQEHTLTGLGLTEAFDTILDLGRRGDPQAGRGDFPAGTGAP